MKKPLRIALVSNNYTPYSGGVVSSLDATVQALKDEGHEVCIITLNFLGDEHKDPAWVYRVPCVARCMYKTNHMALPWRPDHQVLRIVTTFNPDIVHVHHPILLGVSGRNAARKLGVPVIFTHHTMYEAYAYYLPVPLPTKFLQRIIRYVIKRFCNSVDAIIAPGSAVKNILKVEDVRTPIEIIPSAVQQFLLHKTMPVKKHSADGVIQLLVVSRFTKEKNLPFLFDVLTRLNIPYRAFFVGYGNQYDELKRHAHTTLQLSSDKVHFIHHPSDERLSELYQLADLFLFSSRTDTQGIALAEAMAGGNPVIALDGPGQRDIIVQGENGFLVRDASEMAEMIRMLDGDRSRLARMQYAAWQTAAQYFPQQMGTALIDLYRMMLIRR